MINSLLATTLATYLTVASPVQVLSQHGFSLDNRYPVASVNEVFKKNILLNLAYLDGEVKSKQDLNWDTVLKPKHTSFTLKPGEVFAYHENVLPEYEGKVAITTKAHFDSTQGFISDGYLVGDGVCHLASLINWVAQDAGLDVKVTKNHDFAPIAEVPKKYGVSIYTNASVKGSGANNNLYITNNKVNPVQFNFDYTDNKLVVWAVELTHQISSASLL